MSRILLLIPFVVWMSWPPGDPDRSIASLWGGIAIFFGGYAALIALMATWSRVLTYRAVRVNLSRRMGRFHRGMFAARMMVPLWLIIGLSMLGWRDLVGNVLGLDHMQLELPSLLVGTLPCFLAWMGLWWAQYPIERATREQNVLYQFDQDLPVHAPPTFANYFWINFRLQVLFTLVPVLLILGIVDLSAAALRPLTGGLAAQQQSWLHNGILLAIVAAVYLVSPEILRRVLPTQPLDDPNLRARLMRLAERHKLRVRDILLWRTHHNICNAAVMGVIGRFRYVLLTDLLLETMSDEQIEAVFAHEIGHVVHRHMQWYVLVLGGWVLALAGIEQALLQWTGPIHGWKVLGLSAGIWLTLAAAGAFLLAFGFLSRRFERQADVFAARTMQQEQPTTVLANGGGMVVAEVAPSNGSYVGPYGAMVFASALHRVASVNNIPVVRAVWRGGSLSSMFSSTLDRVMEWTNHYLHGSIPLRMDYLRDLSQDPSRTHRFDRFMARLYRGLLVLFVISALLAFHEHLIAMM